MELNYFYLFLIIPIISGVILFFSPAALFHTTCFFSRKFRERAELGEGGLKDLLKLFKTEIKNAQQIEINLCTDEVQNNEEAVVLWHEQGIYKQPLSEFLNNLMLCYYPLDGKFHSNDVLVIWRRHQIKKTLKEMQQEAAYKSQDLSFIIEKKPYEPSQGYLIIKNTDHLSMASTNKNVTDYADDGTSLL